MKMFFTLVTLSILITGMSTSTYAASITLLAGDKDNGDYRESYDVTNNMDFFVTQAGLFGSYFVDHGYQAVNNKGYIRWDYNLPANVGTILGGFITIRTFDPDPGDNMPVTYKADSGALSYLGNIIELPVTNGIQYDHWEAAANAHAAGAIPAWTLTTFNFSSGLLAAMNNSINDTLSFEILNTITNWGAVVDWAEITLEYEPVPEPATLILFGIGVSCLGGLYRRKKLS
jgi:PEP-CTERM motif